jgi:Ca2+-binding EF-hand superfamily protein
MTINKKNLFISKLLAGASLSMALACGGGGTGGTGGLTGLSSTSQSIDSLSQFSDAENVGFFIDSAVAGVEYQSGRYSGVTDESGRFRYETNATVRFKIGDVVLGEAVAGETMTPIDLVEGASDDSNRAVVNMLRLIQSLDSDGNPDNGIDISEDISEKLKGVDSIRFDQDTDGFEFDNTTSEILGRVKRKLVDPDTARSHFKETREQLSDERAGFKKQDGLMDGISVEERFSTNDTNNDSQLSFDEFKAGMETRTSDKVNEFFTFHDSNEDGNITLEEMKSDARKGGKRIHKEDVEEKFNEVDADSNGEIIKDEFDTHLRDELPERAEELFERLDANEDKVLELDEVLNRTKDRKNHSDRMDEKHEELDTDDNGVLDRDEFINGAPSDHTDRATEHFSNLDENQDSVLSKEEFWVKKRR